MPKGLSLADPNAFRNDWFVHQAPQPHWFFDLVTWGGERVGMLPLAYLVWWILSLTAFGFGATWLSRRLLGGRAWPSLLLGPVLVTGPLITMGTSGPILGSALPHMLGGCIAFAALAALVSSDWRTSAVLSAITGVIHVQHGANLAPVLLAAAVLGRGLPRQTRGLLAGAAGLLVLIAVAVTHLRQIDSGGAEWLEICEQAAPFHCDANSWSWSYLLSGAVIVALCLGLCFAHRHAWRTIGPALALPAFGAFVAVVADRLDVPTLGSLAQRTNAYRLATLVMPFAAFAIIALAVTPIRGRRTLPLLGSAGVLALWISGPYAPFGEAGTRTQPLLLMASAVLIGGTILRLGLDEAQRNFPLRMTVAVGAVLAVMILPTGRIGRRTMSYDRRDPVVAASLQLRSRVPSGSVIAAAPGLAWVGPISRHAVIADCKRVPYGGALWREYKRRMAALGGRDCSPVGTSFQELTAEQVLALRSRYGATHVLLRGDDPKMKFADSQWFWVAQADPRDDPRIDSGWSVFKLPDLAP